MEIRTPSLMQIPEDIPRLASHFLERFRYIRVVSGISDEAMKVLMRCPWPGNVRQLANAIEHALGIGTSEWVEPEDLPTSVLGAKEASTQTRFEAEMDEFKRTLVTRFMAAAKGNSETVIADFQLPCPLFHGRCGRCNRRVGLSNSRCNACNRQSGISTARVVGAISSVDLPTTKTKRQLAKRTRQLSGRF